MLNAFGLERRVEEPDSLRNRVFSIILRRASISPLYFVCAEAKAAALAEVTALEIKCYIVGFITERAMLEMSS